MTFLTSGVVACLLMAPGSGPVAFSYPNELTRWVVAQPPGFPGSVVSNYDCSVFLDRGRASATLRSRVDRAARPMPFTIERGKFADGLQGRMSNFEVLDGWLVSFDAGEWGTCLWWFSKDGKRRYKVSTKHWINGFLPTESGLMAYTGVSHGPANEGGLIRLARGDDGRWRAVNYLPMNEVVHCVLKDAAGTVLVVTNSRLVRLNIASKAMDVLVSDVHWNELSPNSIVAAPDGSIYVGMRYCVAKVGPRRGTVEYLWPIPNSDRMNIQPTGFH